MHDEAVDRRALKSVGVQFFANGATYATIIPRLPEIRDQVGISIGTLGLVLTVASVASLIGSAFAGRVTARIGSRRVMIYGATMSIGFLPIIGFATSAVVLAVALFGLAVLRHLHRRRDERAGLGAERPAAHAGDEPPARSVEPRHGHRRSADRRALARRCQHRGPADARRAGADRCAALRRARPAAS